MNPIVQLPFTEINLDLENPRFNGEDAENQIDAIKKLFEVEKPDYFYNLADDICNHRLNPGENYLVIKQDDQYIVLEGNRRLATLKILLNPALCPVSKLVPKFKKLSDKFLKNPITKINCSILSNRESGDRWIDLKHADFDSKGISTQKWTTEARHARHNKKYGPKISAQILKYVCSDNGFPQHVIDACKKIDLTTSDRMFNYRCARSFFGYSITERTISWPSPENIENSNATKLLLSQFILYFIENNLNVNDVYYSEKTEHLLRKIVTESNVTLEDMNYFGNPPIDTNKTQDKDKDTDNQTQSADINNGNRNSTNDNNDENTTKSDSSKEGNNKGTETKKPTRSYQDQGKRVHVINNIMQIRENKLNAIYLELKDKINVQETPYAASMLLRSFIELSCDYYMAVTHKKTIQFHNGRTTTSLKENSNLSDKIKGIADVLKTQNKINTKEHSTIFSEANVEKTQGNTGSVVWLHSCVHNYTHNILPAHVIVAYDNFKPLIVSIWGE